MIATAMLLIILLIAIGVYIASRRLLISTQTGDVFTAQAIPLYIYQLFLLITGFLVFLSTSIFTLTNFFKNKQIDWLMVSPRYTSIFWVNIVKASLNYSWPIIIIVIPLVLAAYEIFDFSLLGLLLAFLSIILFSLICSLIAICLILIISTFLLVLKSLNLRSLTTASVFLISGLAYLIWHKIVKMDLTSIFQIDELESSSLSFIENYFNFSPAHLPASLLYNLQNNNLEGAFSFFLFIILILLSLFILLQLLKRSFLPVYQVLQVGQFKAQTKLSNKQSKSLFYKPKSPNTVFYYKELLQSIRSPKNLLWLLFLSALLFAQIGTLSLIAKYSKIGDFIINETLVAIQLSIVLFFISAFVLRFVFPALSQEGKTAWIIASMPINIFKIYLSKLKFYTILLTLIAIASISLYIIPQNTSFLISGQLITMLIISVFTLNILGLSFGTFFINLNTNDPDELSSSGPGIIFTILALVYSALNSYLLYLALIKSSFYPILASVIFSLLLSYFLIKKSHQYLKTLEYK